MILEIGLLDALALIAGCGSVSDLRYLDGWQQEHLARALEKIPAGVASLAEWNDALHIWQEIRRRKRRRMQGSD